MILRMLKRRGRQQKGLTLLELMVVMAIMAILAALVGGALAGVSSTGQQSRLASDDDTIGKSVDRFYSDAFPQVYPVDHSSELLATGTATAPAPPTKAGVINWDFGLPQDARKTFVPTYLKDIPDSAALVSWRVDERSGEVFYAKDGALLLVPSKARLSVSPASKTKGALSDYTFTLKLNQHEAASSQISVSVPAGYGVGAGALTPGTQIGSVSGTFLSDNPWTGIPITFSGVVEVVDTNTWHIKITMPVGVPGAGLVITHVVQVTRPTDEVAGKLLVTLTASPNWNTSSQETAITISAPTAGDKVIKNPSVAGVYRWGAQETTTIDVAGVFQDMPGARSVLIPN